MNVSYFLIHLVMGVRTINLEPYFFSNTHVISSLHRSVGNLHFNAFNMACTFRIYTYTTLNPFVTRCKLAKSKVQMKKMDACVSDNFAPILSYQLFVWVCGGECGVCVACIKAFKDFFFFFLLEGQNKILEALTRN